MRLVADQISVCCAISKASSIVDCYLVGGTSPFGTRRAMPVFIEASILELPKILINGGRRGYLVGIDPQVCVILLAAKTVQCALRD